MTLPRFFQKEKTMDYEELTEAEWELVRKMTRDMTRAGALLDQDECRFLVSRYYIFQEQRLSAANRMRKLKEKWRKTGQEGREPNLLLNWSFDTFEMLERNLKRALTPFAKEYRLGRWLLSICGIGPIMSAGFLANLDIVPPERVGNWFAFCGVDPTQIWERGQKRPYSADLKQLMYHAGSCFIKNANRKTDFYGAYYAKRKKYETAQAASGKIDILDQIESALARKWRQKEGNIEWEFYSGCYPKTVYPKVFEFDTVAERNAYLKKRKKKPGGGQPMLPPARVTNRARRWTAKLFLSHLHRAWWCDYHGADTVEEPWAIRCEGHSHVIDPPNWPITEEGKSIRELSQATRSEVAAV
jgi:hypothetical protein